MTRAALISLAALAAGLLLAGCGSEGVGRRRLGPSSARSPSDPRARDSGLQAHGRPGRGQGHLPQVAGCVGCHTLPTRTRPARSARTSTRPSPTSALATARVTHGQGAMPSFKGQLTDQQIADVARTSSRRPAHADGRSSFRRLPARVAAFAFDLDRTLIAEDAVLRPRTRAAIAAVRAPGIARDRRHRAHVPRRRGPLLDAGRARRPGRLLPGRRRRRPARASGCATCRSRGSDALEAIDAVIAAGFHLNCYVDDELYVAAVTPEARAYADFQHLESTRSATCASWLTADPTKLVAVGDPGGARRARGRLKPRFGGRLFISKSLPHFLEFAHPGREQGRRASLRRRAARLHAERRRSRSATARTTASCSTGPASASRSRTRTRTSAPRRPRLPVRPRGRHRTACSRPPRLPP